MQDNLGIIFIISPYKHMWWVLIRIASFYNICFYGELTKIIIKYPPYLFHRTILLFIFQQSDIYPKTWPYQKLKLTHWGCHGEDLWSTWLSQSTIRFRCWNHWWLTGTRLLPEWQIPPTKSPGSSRPEIINLELYHMPTHEHCRAHQWLVWPHPQVF